MEKIIYTKNYFTPDVNTFEVLRYAGMKNENSDIDAVLKECLEESLVKLSYKVCWTEFSVCETESYMDLEFTKCSSQTMRKGLKDCGSVILFAATVGLELDRLIAKYSRVSPAKALIFQALGAERIESLCDTFFCEMKNEKTALGKILRPRFSPGYGDLEIDIQREIFRVLEPSRRIGLTLNESLIMSPTKSVTAFMGVSEKTDGVDYQNSCEACGKENCVYRSGI